MLELSQVRRYSWADEDVNLAWTVAVVTGSTATELVRAYGGDPNQPPNTRTFHQPQVPPEDLGDYSLVQVFAKDQYVIALENNGWLGQGAEVAERASQNGRRFFSLYWSLNANYKVTQALNGALVARFDPLSVQHPAPVGEHYPDWITDVVFTDESLHAILLATMEQQTGLAFDRAWLDEPHPTYRVIQP